MRTLGRTSQASFKMHTVYAIYSISEITRCLKSKTSIGSYELLSLLHIFFFLLRITDSSEFRIGVGCQRVYSERETKTVGSILANDGVL